MQNKIKYDYKFELKNTDGDTILTHWCKSNKEWLEDYENRLCLLYGLKGKMDYENGCGYILCEDGSVVSYTRQVRGEI